MPWVAAEYFEAPQGMLERPESCKFAKHCARDRVCWAAKQRELDGHRQNEVLLKSENRVAADLTSIPVARRSVLDMIEEAAELEFPEDEAA